MAKCVSIDQAHQNGMSVGIYGGWSGEFVRMQQLHKQKLSNRAQSRQIKPIIVSSVLNILSILLDTPERVTAEPSQLQNDDLTIRIDAFINV